MLSGVKVASAGVCVGVWERLSNGDSQGWLGQLYG